MGDDGTWYKRVLSWNPLNALKLVDDDDECKQYRNSMDSTDSRRVERFGLQRRHVIKHRRAESIRQIMSPLKRETVLEIENIQREDKIRSCIINAGPTDSIFDMYYPWKGDSIQKEIDKLSDDNSRAIFKFSWKGNYDELEMLLHLPEFNGLINITDSKGRTPLHISCAEGHADVVSLLLSRGANPNALDKSKCISPLMCAAVNANEAIMDLMLANGADVNQGLGGLEIVDDTESLNMNRSYSSHTALLWAVRAGKISSVKYLLSKGARLSGTVTVLETPIHEAAYWGYHKILKILLKHGLVSENVELRGGPLRNSPLHIAVEQGHIKCIKVLLAAGASPNSVNLGRQTALHLAASTADSEAMELLINSKPDLDIQDSRERSALHYLVVHFKGYETVDCMELLLRNGAEVNLQDELGYTAFHLAVMYDCSPLVVELLRNGADLTVRIKSGQSGLEILVKKMPHAIRYVKESLDLAITLKDKDIADPDCTLTFDFRAIVTTADRKVPAIPKFYKETEFLSSLCGTHKYILSHPLIEAFLILKWQKVRKYFWASFAFNFLMVMAYSWFLVAVYSIKCPIKGNEYNPSQNNTECENQENTRDWIFYSARWSKRLLIILTSIFLTKELLQMVFSPLSYIKLFENYVQVTFIITILVTVFPALTTLDGICCRLTPLGYRFAAVGIVVAWFSILLKIGKMPTLGLYVQMLLNVVNNFGIFTVAYASILIAFALSFAILFRNNPEFNNVFISLQSVLIMMTGEINIQHVLDKDLPHTTTEEPLMRTLPEADSTACKSTITEKLPLHIVAHIMFAMFILLVTIVLMNLLVGLAVSDIQGLRKGAKVARLSRLVVAISQLESIVFSRGLIIILPKEWKHKLQRSALVVPNDNQYTFNFRPYDPRDTRLPQSLQIDALSVVEEVERQKIFSTGKTSKCSANIHETSSDLQEKIQNMENSINSLGSAISEIHKMLRVQLESKK